MFYIKIISREHDHDGTWSFQSRLSQGPTLSPQTCPIAVHPKPTSSLRSSKPPGDNGFFVGITGITMNTIPISYKSPFTVCIITINVVNIVDNS